MKIMFNTMGLGKGGAERVINILSNNFIKNNSISIVTNINSSIDYKFDKKINVIPLTTKKYKKNKVSKLLEKMSIKKIVKLKEEILEYKPDIIISFLPEPCFRLLFLKIICKKIKQIPVIISVRNDPKTEYSNPIYKFIMKKLYPLADELILQTNESKEYFEKEIKKSGTVIFNPVSDEFMVKRYIGEREKNIVAVGRLESQKNYKMLIDAYKIVYKKHPDYKLNIYGEGILRKELTEYIKEKKLDNVIFLKGKVDNVKQNIFKATAFVMTSDYEGMPNSLLEASCLGLPCVSTNCPCGGPREILNGGENGILVNTRDYKAFADAICLLIENKKLNERYSKKANEYSKNFSTEKIVEEWIEVVNKQIKK